MSTNMTLITSVTVGSGGAASVTLPATGTIPATYTDLKILVSARTTDTNSKVMDISFNGNTSSFTNRYLLASDNSALSGADFNRFSNLQNSSSNTSNTFSNGEIYIPNYAGSNYKSYSGDGVQETNASTGANLVLVAGLWSNTAAITSITLSPVVGSWVEGSTFYLYGISNVTSTTKATGGIVSSDGTYNYHMFPYSGTFTPTEAISADILVVAGGGSGGSDVGGGGGAGGLLDFTSQSLTAQNYTITVGGGGAGVSGTNAGNTGSDSQFGSLTLVKGGGGGGNYQFGNEVGKTGGSGGGAQKDATGTLSSGGAGTSGQGNAGGGASTDNATYRSSGGGGGKGAAGGNGANSAGGSSGSGGVGSSSYSSWANATQTGDNGYYAGGGGGGNMIPGAGGLGGGTAGVTSGASANAKANTGGGSGGGSPSGNGGSGLVIIRYAI